MWAAIGRKVVSGQTHPKNALYSVKDVIGVLSAYRLYAVNIRYAANAIFGPLYLKLCLKITDSRERQEKIKTA